MLKCPYAPRNSSIPESVNALTKFSKRNCRTTFQKFEYSLDISGIRHHDGDDTMIRDVMDLRRNRVVDVIMYIVTAPYMSQMTSPVATLKSNDFCFVASY